MPHRGDRGGAGQGSRKFLLGPRVRGRVWTEVAIDYRSQWGEKVLIFRMQDISGTSTATLLQFCIPVLIRREEKKDLLKKGKRWLPGGIFQYFGDRPAWREWSSDWDCVVSLAEV